MVHAAFTSGEPTRRKTRTSQVVQLLRHRVPNAGGPGSIPGQGTRSRMLQLKKDPTCRNEDLARGNEDPECRNSDPVQPNKLIN